METERSFFGVSMAVLPLCRQLAWHVSRRLRRLGSPSLPEAPPFPATGFGRAATEESLLAELRSGAFDRAAELDPEGTLVAKALPSADGETRQELIAAVARSGRIPWLRALWRSQALLAFTPKDWDGATRALERANNADAIWWWALHAPALRARALLKALPIGATLPAALDPAALAPDQWAVIAELVGAAWPASIADALIGLLRSRDCLPSAPPAHRVAVALACGWPERLAGDGPEVVAPLLEARGRGRERTREMANRALAHLQRQDTIDVLCRHWLETGEADDDCSRILRAAGQAPADPAERAVFWLLNGEVARYEALDPEGALLQHAQATAGSRLRQRLAVAAAATGRVEWLRGLQISQPLSAFTAEDWTTTVRVLTRAGDGDALWQWALRAPPPHSRALLLALPVDTPPPPRLGAGAGDLRALARDLPPAVAEGGALPWGVRHTLAGHSDAVRCLAWSPDGRWLASGGEDTVVRVWSVEDGACRQRLAGHRGAVESLAWSPDGHCLASSGRDGTIWLWNPVNGVPMRRRPDRVTSRNRGETRLAWTRDGRRLGLFDDDGLMGFHCNTSGIDLVDDGDGVPRSSGARPRTLEDLQQSIDATWRALERDDGQHWVGRGPAGAGPTDARSLEARSPDGRSLAVLGDHHAIVVKQAGLDVLMATPLACFSPQHWRLLAACKIAADPDASAANAVVLPWLRFLSALESQIRRFDVEVEEAFVTPNASAYAVIIDD